jgi:hypothetical protein
LSPIIIWTTSKSSSAMRATGLPRDSFDLTTAQLVLPVAPEPEQIIAEMVALVRPGGMVALHEVDLVTHLCDPPLPAWSQLVQARLTYAQINGNDLFIGRRVARLLRAAGLVEVQIRSLVHVYHAGHARRTILVDFVENLRERLLVQGVVSEAGLLESLKQYLADSDTLVISHLVVQVWGRKLAH